MQQYNEQFMNRYMLPLLGEVVTDMSKGEKNLYLGKLLQGQPMLPLERDEFVRYYFENRQSLERKQPFIGVTPEEARKFWYDFTDDFSKNMIMRFRLSGTEGTRMAFFPGKEGDFSQEVTKNMYDLAYRITNDFEQARIAQLIEKEKAAAEAAGDRARAEKAARDKELLALGKLKMIVVDGVERYMSEEEMRAAAKSSDPAVKAMKVAPATQAGLGKMKDSGTAKGALESGAKGSVTSAAPTAEPAMSAGAPSSTGAATATAAPSAAAPPAEPAQEATSGFADLQDDFVSSSAAATDRKYENLVSKMADNGLQIVPNTFKNPRGEWNIDENGLLNGEVKDRKGQRLKVRINVDLGANDPDKFEFIFLDADGRPMRSADGSIIAFKSSENDLEGFKTGDATQMLQRTRPDLAKEKQGLRPPSEKPGLPGEMPATGFDLRMGKPTLEGAEMPKIEGEMEVPAPGVKIPEGAKVRERMPMGPAATVTGMPTGITTVRAPAPKFQQPKIGARPVPPTSVAGRKKAVREQRAQTPGAQMPPSFEPPRPGVTAARPKKKKVPWGAIAAVGGNSALIGGTVWGAGAVATAEEEKTALTMLQHAPDTLAHLFVHAGGLMTHLADALIAHLTGGSFFV